MELQILNMLKGYVRIRITGNSYDRFLNLCASRGIRLWQLLPSGESYEAYVSRKDFKKLKAIVKKSHAAVRITQRHGLPFFIHKYRKRKIYVAGVAAAFFLMLWLSAHVWNISIDGNVSQTDDVMFEYLAQTGIRHGMWKSRVDCRELAADLRNYFDRFAWVAAELKGTRLIIHVKEGIAGEEDKPEETAPSSLVASHAGVVRSIYTRSGLPAVRTGDIVEKGDLLVSGVLPIYNDNGEIASCQYVAADADIVIQYRQRYYDEVPASEEKKYYSGREKAAWMVMIGEIPLSLPNRFDAFAQYDLVSELQQCRIMKNFYLPVYLRKLTAKEYVNVEVVHTKEELERMLEANFLGFRKNLEEKGVQLFENDVKIEWNEKSAIASGTLSVGAYAVNRVAEGR